MRIQTTVGDHSAVWIDGERESPRPSLKIRNHSPTGFSWGYGGSGPSQLALAILYAVTRDADTAQRHYMQFKWDYVSQWPADSDVDVEIDILGWIRQQEEGR